MTTYEITYILKPELTNDEQESMNKTVTSYIEGLGGKVDNVQRTFSYARGGADENNLRKFAYPIKKYRQGYYYTMVFDLEGVNLKELEGKLDLENSILRYLVVKDFVALKEIDEATELEKRAQEKVIKEMEGKERKNRTPKKVVKR
jgi:small subunit ribosomal protein S6